MDIRNRLADVDGLRCKTLQDFLKMVIRPNWKEDLYKYVKVQVEQNQYLTTYKPMYSKMKDIGVDNYAIDYMDVSAIIAVILYTGIANVSSEVKRELKAIHNDRNNSSSHLNENEPNEELYLRGIVSLLNLKDFVRTVDDKETEIDEAIRDEYRKKYIKEIQNLSDLLDDERISYIGMRREVEKDIKAVLEDIDARNKKGQDKYWTWINLSESYLAQYKAKRLDEYTQAKTYLFFKMASDAGITLAHDWAAFFSACKGISEDLEKRLLLMLADKERDLSRQVIENITQYMMGEHGEARDITEGLRHIVDLVREKGHVVDQDENGYYYLKN